MWAHGPLWYLMRRAYLRVKPMQESRAGIWPRSIWAAEASHVWSQCNQESQSILVFALTNLSWVFCHLGQRVLVACIGQQEQMSNKTLPWTLGDQRVFVPGELVVFSVHSTNNEPLRRVLRNLLSKITSVIDALIVSGKQGWVSGEVDGKGDLKRWRDSMFSRTWAWGWGVGLGFWVPALPFTCCMSFSGRHLELAGRQFFYL